MAELCYPDGDLSRVVLVGAAEYASDELPAIPAVHGNLASLGSALTYEIDPRFSDRFPASHSAADPQPLPEAGHLPAGQSGGAGRGPPADSGR